MTGLMRNRPSSTNWERCFRASNKKARKKDEVEAPEIEEEEKAEGMADLMTALEKSMHAVKKGGPVKHGKN